MKNEVIAVALQALLNKSEVSLPSSTSLDKLLYNVDAEENYNLLEDIYETLNYDCGSIGRIESRYSIKH
ncbi:head-specific guanylate cyclase [Vespula maculifrons]|uniref:Head-specific guanylate cyclase n=1 Tax=Vespula maculifrons TaxID=7453 RepID=A0ABD2CQC5_VESMC